MAEKYCQTIEELREWAKGRAVAMGCNLTDRKVEAVLKSYEVCFIHGQKSQEARIRELEAEVVKIARAHAEQQDEIRGLRDNVARKDAALAAAGKAIAQYDWFVDSYVYQPDSDERTDYINHRVMVINEGRAARALIAAALKEEKA